MPMIVTYRDVNFQGPVKVFTEPMKDLAAIKWNDLISSVIVVEGSWVLYERDQKQIVERNGGPERNGLYPNPQSWKGRNDAIVALVPQT